MVRWKASLVAFALVTGVAGCGKVATPDALPAPVDPARDDPTVVEPNCPKEAGLGPGLPMPGQPAPDQPQTERGGVPADFVTSWVLRCRTDTRDLPGQGQWSVLLTERADTDAAELVEQLRRPSDPLTAEACTLELVIPPYFLLVDAAGTAILPAVPTDTCGKPRREVLELINSLPYRTLSEEPVAQVQTPLAAETGCSDSYKDMIAIAGTGRPAPAAPLWPDADSLRVCVYDRISGGELPVGNLAAGRTLDGAAATTVLAALGAAGPAAACSAPHTRFAVLTVPSSGQWATVELDGCHRLQRPDDTLGQLDAATVAKIAQ